jgi:hydroxymethylglutaryl-CoA lyase
MVHLTECPRDAMQGIQNFIPTDQKVAYLNQLLKVGFDVLDFGSFVSPKAIPQMKDTSEVLAQLDLDNTFTELLAIVANLRGAEDASKYSPITYLGYPFSVSEEFQLRNTRTTREQALDRVAEILELCTLSDKELVVYLSMGFGNPYEEDWSPQIVADWTGKLRDIGVKRFALSDTIGTADPSTISTLFQTLTSDFSDMTWGVHLHTTPHLWQEKVAAAYEAGCRRFDGAIKGYGGCPMAKDDLTGNMPSELMIQYLSKHEALKLNHEALTTAIAMANEVFPA